MEDIKRITNWYINKPLDTQHGHQPHQTAN